MPLLCLAKDRHFVAFPTLITFALIFDLCYYHAFLIVSLINFKTIKEERDVDIKKLKKSLMFKANPCQGFTMKVLHQRLN